MSRGRARPGPATPPGAEDGRPRTLRLVAVQNMEGEGFPRFERHLARQGHAWRVVRADRDEPFPDPRECDAVFVGGSPLAAYEWEDHPFLRREAAFLRRAVDADLPVFGVCFGAQFLAHLLGGRAYRAHRRELGLHRVHLTEDGRRDPLLAGCPPVLDVVQWHGDTFDLPPGASHLVRGEAIRHQMYRRDRVVGVQFHPEATAVEVAGWADAHPGEVEAAGTTKDQVLAECRAQDGELDRLAVRLVDNFIAALVRAGA